jgi:ubiquinone/menaquinone biosynthesis C-methylase UbiE
MSELKVEKPEFSNWVSKKLIIGPGVLFLIFGSLSFWVPILWIIAAFFFLISAYFAYAHYRFSPAGGNIQARILDLLISRLDWNGQGNALDIGCGNGPLTIRLAQKYPEARVTGIDYWEKNWDYSKSVCEQNARVEGVGERVVFQKASASALPFEDGKFDLAVSNLVFHEVRGTKDKRELVREALRVVKKGGRFTFQDLFVEKMLYGEPEDLLKEIRSWGISRVEFVRTCDQAFIPWMLKLPFMVGKIGIIWGEK